MKKNKVAILIFANSAEKEASLKTFSSSKELFEILNRKTLQIAKKTGLPYFLYSEKEQVGNTFGERFTHAIQSVYNKGFDTVITVGNDTPHITANHFKETIKKLENNDIILGPSTDGGFYLLGLKKAHFNTALFLKLPWQTSKLNSSISKLKTLKKVAISYLEVLTDLDSASDAKKIINSNNALSNVIKELLYTLVHLEKRIISIISILVEHTFFKLQYNKGSPLLLHL